MQKVAAGQNRRPVIASIRNPTDHQAYRWLKQAFYTAGILQTATTDCTRIHGAAFWVAIK
jgi:hypothetical protein